MTDHLLDKPHLCPSQKRLQTICRLFSRGAALVMAALMFSGPAVAFDLHPPLRDDGAAWAARAAATDEDQPMIDADIGIVDLERMSAAILERLNGLEGTTSQLRAIWFFDQGAVPAAALVFDITAAE
ncbi:hypothetical protein [Fodinicurvata sp. EGI_FJ10296]|uniref:hypothetical protein n=1 Tax=Fodinicurvata sp. EGI_FJ10296 TaxID=3231908 RepID=UPI003455C818